MLFNMYMGKSINEFQIQVATDILELCARNSHRQMESLSSSIVTRNDLETEQLIQISWHCAVFVG